MKLTLTITVPTIRGRPPAIIRLRRALKGLWRAYGVKVVAIEPTEEPKAMTTTDIRQRLQAVQSRLAELTAEQRQLQGERDKLLREQLDNEGCDDRRPVAVR